VASDIEFQQKHQLSFDRSYLFGGDQSVKAGDSYRLVDFLMANQ
jgi:hypothetical protein